MPAVVIPDFRYPISGGERGTHWDKKVDLRLSKTVRVGRFGVQGIVEAFNVSTPGTARTTTPASGRLRS
jgi:hypothetical protein